MDAFLTIFFFILIIGFLVFVHELGHFMAARLSGVRVEEFAIGFGPSLLSKEYKGTLYSVKLLPLGGFVALAGEQDEDIPDGFRNKSYIQKFAVLMGGIFMNVITAIILLGIYLNIVDNQITLPAITSYSFHNIRNGQSNVLYPIQVSYIPEGLNDTELLEGDVIVGFNGNIFSSYSDFIKQYDEIKKQETVSISLLDINTFSIAEEQIKVAFTNDSEYVVQVDDSENSILKKGDVIKEMNGEKLKGKDNFYSIRDSFAGKEVLMKIEREGKEIEENVYVFDNENGSGSLKIHVSFPSEIGFFDIAGGGSPIYFLTLKNNILSPVTFAFDLTFYQAKGIASLISDAVSSGDFEEVGKTVGGPIAVGNVVNSIVVSEIYESFIFITALISLSLAMFNILPVPALDGGQLLFVTIESIRGNKFKTETLNKVNLVGFIFLILLSIIIFTKDIRQFNIIGNILDVFRSIFGK